MTSAIGRKRVLATSPAFFAEVTEEILKRALIKNSRKCVIAEAIREAQPTAEQILVDLQTIRFSLPEKGLRYVYMTPQACQRVLIHFDQGMSRELKPFKFRLHNALQIVGRQPKYSRIASISAKRRRGEELTAEEEAILEMRRESRRRPQSVGGRLEPTLIGGKPLPVARVDARDRQFGARALKR